MLTWSRKRTFSTCWEQKEPPTSTLEVNVLNDVTAFKAAVESSSSSLPSWPFWSVYVTSAAERKDTALALRHAQYRTSLVTTQRMDQVQC